MLEEYTTAVVIPSYKVKKHISDVLRSIPSFVTKVYVVDDCCPEESGKFVQENCADERVEVLFHKENQGVGGAVITGYKKALEDKVNIVVKIDGDGQMDPTLIAGLIKQITQGKADYTKGNRFFYPRTLAKMPWLRLVGNSALSFINKFVNGYWHIMDPTNGFTAIHRSAIELLDLDKISKRYFFESDMLFRLAICRAVVEDFPMLSKYEDEESNLSIRKVLFEFPPKYLKRFIKRIIYTYFLRDFNAGTFYLVLGKLSTWAAIIYGGFHWYKYNALNESTPTGTIMIATVLLLVGIQSMVAFFNFDISSKPQRPIQANN